MLTLKHRLYVSVSKPIVSVEIGDSIKSLSKGYHATDSPRGVSVVSMSLRQFDMCDLPVIELRIRKTIGYHKMRNMRSLGNDTFMAAP